MCDNSLVLVDFSNIAFQWGLGTIAGIAKNGIHVDVDNIVQYNQTLTSVLEFEISQLEQKIQVSRKNWVWIKDCTPEYKRSIDPQYKNKPKVYKFDPRNWVEQVLRMEAKRIGVMDATWVQSYDGIYEADDVIATICKRTLVPLHIVSNDRDLWSLINDRVSCWNPRTRTKITIDDVIKSFDLTDIKNILLHKTCFGDTSDNVPNCAPRIKNQVLDLIRKCDGNFDILIEQIKNCTDVKVRNKLEENMSRLFINYSLVSFCDNIKLDTLVVRS
jgi:hypothetical protein